MAPIEAADARAWLEGHVDLERRPHGEVPAPTVERIRAVVELLGSPQLEYPAIHLTGTNGKSSTARMIARLLGATRLSAGLYTSPHLSRVNERLCYADEPIDDEALGETLARVALVEEHVDVAPTYFEVLTAAALSWFADVAVQAAVIEVGLGGRYDATNVVDAEVAVVTNVAVDHTEYLGSTRAEIAAEKAGIVKPGCTLVLGETDPDLVGYFLDEGASVVRRRDVDFAVRTSRMAHGGRLMDLSTPRRAYDDVFVPLHGAHQTDNAAIALTAAEEFLGDALPEDVVTRAFAGVTSPGRLEVVGHQPLVLLDGAHNVAAAHALRQSLDEEFSAAPRTWVVGFLRERDPREMLAALGAQDATLVVCVRPPSPRALDPRVVGEAARELGLGPRAVRVVDDVGSGVGEAIGATRDDNQVVVTGSLYVAGAARAALVPAADAAAEVRR